MKKYPVEITPFLLQHFSGVPGDGFSFAVGVRSQKNFIGITGSLLQGFDNFLLARDRNIFGFESVFDINAHFFSRQILYMPDGRRNIIIFAEILFNGSDFCR